MSLSREQILSSPATPATEEVPVPEWGGAVRVRVMSGTQRDAFERRVLDDRRAGNIGANMRALIVVFCTVDETGAQLFTEADLERLGREPWTVLERITNVSARLNRLTDREIAEAEKNS